MTPRDRIRAAEERFNRALSEFTYALEEYKCTVPHSASDIDVILAGLPRSNGSGGSPCQRTEGRR